MSMVYTLSILGRNSPVRSVFHFRMRREILKVFSYVFHMIPLGLKLLCTLITYHRPKTSWMKTILKPLTWKTTSSFEMSELQRNWSDWRKVLCYQRSHAHFMFPDAAGYSATKLYEDTFQCDNSAWSRSSFHYLVGCDFYNKDYGKWSFKIAVACYLQLFIDVCIG